MVYETLEDQISDLMHKNRLLSKRQFGFVKIYQLSMLFFHLLKLLGKIQTEKICCYCFPRFIKSFDSIYHKT